ncbi:MAG: hypothetical protein MZV65_13305 [Chromatiales bacterium]|nr:hypothetical protein [Chromatiales bacterium]
MVVTYARCCRPIPGDPILGYLSAGRGITVHTRRLPATSPSSASTRSSGSTVHWEAPIERVFPVNVRVEVKNQARACWRRWRR